MDTVIEQGSKLWELVVSKETAATYQKALNLTGTILKEAAQLIWLTICSAFVFGAWFSDTTVRSGKSIRDWVDKKANPSSDPTEQTSLADTGKSLLDTGRVGIANLLNQAREQLGIDPEELPAVERTVQAVKPAPESKTAAPEKTASVPPQPSPSAAAAPPKEPPTVKPFEKGASTQSEETPGSQTVGSSRGAGSSPGFSGRDAETSREDATDDWPPQEND